MLCERCHKERYGTTLEQAHCIKTKDKCENCKQVATTSDCHCYLRTEYIHIPAPIRGRVR